MRTDSGLSFSHLLCSFSSSFFSDLPNALSINYELALAHLYSIYWAINPILLLSTTLLLFLFLSLSASFFSSLASFLLMKISAWSDRSRQLD